MQGKKDSMSRNAEGYPDPTPGAAWSNIQQEERAAESERLARIAEAVPALRQTAARYGFYIIGRIPLRDKRTGKEYR